MLHSFNGIFPQVHPTAFIADGVQIIGDVIIEEGASIWYNTVLRGDLAPIRIGKRVNIQDGSVGHVNENEPLILEDDVTVGHNVIIHGCHIGRGTLIGMGAIVLNGVNIGEYALVGAGALITEKKTIPPYTLTLGSPGKVVRELTPTDLDLMKNTTKHYYERGQIYKSQQA